LRSKSSRNINLANSDKHQPKIKSKSPFIDLKVYNVINNTIITIEISRLKVERLKLITMLEIMNPNKKGELYKMTR
jgi:hypothetical protein